jgi:hypothetical protein
LPFLCVPYPTTTTAFNDSGFWASFIETKFSEPTTTSWGEKPTYENCKTCPGLAAMLKFPRASVIVLLEVFFTVTVTPGNGSLVSEALIVPFIIFSWALLVKHKKNKLNISEMRCTTLFIAVNLNDDEKYSYNG